MKTSKSKQKNLNELSQIANGAEMFIATMKTTTAPENMEFVSKIVNLMESKGAIKTLQDRISVVYDQFYSDAEIKGMLKFYKSKLGKKVLSVLPMITAETAKISKFWMEEFMAEHQDEILSATGVEAGNTSDRNVLIKRGLFVAQYMKEKGWGDDLQALTLGQINEIRAQDGWINAERG